MHMTLHITTGCNMYCDYCYSPPFKRIDMNKEVALQAVEYAAKISPFNTGIVFFGGEPLLRKDIIKATIARCRDLEKKTGVSFHYKVSTNGLFLDEQFLNYADSVKMHIAISCDGIKEAHDLQRKNKTGQGTFDILEKKMELLLSHQPYASLLMTVSPKTVQYYAESVQWLLEKRFRYLVVSLNYAGSWTDKHLAELKMQYAKLAKIYERLTSAEKKFYFSPFEVKLASHIRGKDAHCNRCVLGKRQISVAPDGTIYPCVQFVQDGLSDRAFAIGNVSSGIDSGKQEELYQLSLKRPEECESCAIQDRCNNDCSCLNWQTTGSINEISPILCESEKLLISIVDKLGERLYKRRAPMFIQKHYNTAYPILSMLDDI